MSRHLSLKQRVERFWESYRQLSWAELLRAVIEGLILLLVALAPWAFGATEPFFEFVLLAGVALLLLLWGARVCLEGEFTLKRSLALYCLLGIFVLGLYQLLPLPDAVLGRLSPATAALYDELIPTTHEVVDESDGPPPLRGHGSLSLYPGATYRELVRLLAVICLFVVVRNNIDPVGGLRRLSFVALGNGAMLALLGLLQHYSSPRDTIYWTFESAGSVFGPFINRNHFAFYGNLCVGLGLGVLLHLASRSQSSRRRRRRRYKSRTFRSLIRHARGPVFWWIGTGLVFLMAAVAFSLSRGGMLSLLCGLIVFAMFCMRKPAYIAAGALVVGLAFALSFWLGPQPVGARLATLSDSRALKASRLDLWRNAWPLVRDFPVFGTGLGTFSVVEPMHRTSTEGAEKVASHAENEYLEALVEGGFPRLLLTLTAIGFVAFRGIRGLRRRSFGSPDWCILMGGVIAFTTVVVHSCVDFGVHIPAITMAAVVLCAHLVGAGAPAPAVVSNDEPSLTRHRAVWPRPVAFIAALVLVAVLLVSEGFRFMDINRYRVSAARGHGGNPTERASRQVALLSCAAARGPDYALVHAELGQAYAELFEAQKTETQRKHQACRFARELLAYAPSCPGTNPALPLAAAATAAFTSKQELGLSMVKLKQLHLVPALRCYLIARNRCPVLPQPHLRIAFNVGLLHTADSRDAYLRRAQTLVPSDPEVSYVSGLLHLLDGERTAALDEWRQSLEASERFLPGMVAQAQSLPDMDSFLEELLPAEPDVWLKTAYLLDPSSTGMGRRSRPYFERALTLLQQHSLELSASEWRYKGLALFGLGRCKEAHEAYQEALRRNERLLEWRRELVTLLLNHDCPLQASRELRIALQLQPKDPELLKLREAVQNVLIRRSKPSK